MHRRSMGRALCGLLEKTLIRYCCSALSGDFSQQHEHQDARRQHVQIGLLLEGWPTFKYQVDCLDVD